MKLTKDARALCRELFFLCLDNGKVQEGRVREVADALVKDQPRHYLQILRELKRLVRLNLAERQAEVQSARPLASAPAVAKQLRSIHGKDLEIQFKVNPELLGGLRIRIGSKVWDGTVLDRLRQILVSAPRSPEMHAIPPVKASLPEKFKLTYSAS